MVTLSYGGDTICRPGPSNDETMGKQNYKKALKFDVFLSVFLHYFMYSKVMSVHGENWWPRGPCRKVCNVMTQKGFTQPQYSRERIISWCEQGPCMCEMSVCPDLDSEKRPMVLIHKSKAFFLSTEHVACLGAQHFFSYSMQNLVYLLSPSQRVFHNVQITLRSLSCWVEANSKWRCYF